MMSVTLEMGPGLHSYVPGFILPDHDNREVAAEDIMGQRGILLGFTGDIWEPASVRRILWLQRHQSQFAREGVNTALLVCDHPYKLSGYAMSAVEPLHFPLLADADRAVHARYNMENYAGLVLVDSAWLVREKWIMPDERIWPKISDLMTMLATL